jgi:uncharacterized YigZ family protein
MTEQELYYTISEKGVAEFKDRGSRFIGFAFPAANTTEIKLWLQEVKNLHPKAVHHCFAWRLGTAGTQFRVSDDGEPSGSAGRPILSQIDTRGITNTLIVVARYFGGTLLGVPGLINAYKTTASLVLQVTPVVRREIQYLCRLQFDYPRMNDVMRLLKQVRGKVVRTEPGLFSRLEVEIPKAEKETFLSLVKNLYTVEVESL